MSDQEFGDWVSAHVTHTGADPSRLTELLWANRPVIIGKWHASYGDLCECTDRLVGGGRVPQFPAEHPNALYRELAALRSERAKREMTEYSTSHTGKRIHGCDCPDCNGGEVTPEYQAALDKLSDYVKRHGGLAGNIGTGGFT